MDICNDDLYILDHQLDDKDEMDLFNSDDVIANVCRNKCDDVGDPITRPATADCSEFICDSSSTIDSFSDTFLLCNNNNNNSINNNNNNPQHFNESIPLLPTTPDNDSE